MNSPGLLDQRSPGRSGDEPAPWFVEPGHRRRWTHCCTSGRSRRAATTHLLIASAVFFAVVVFVGRGLLTTDEFVNGGIDDADLSSRPGRPGRRYPLALLGLAGGCSIAMEMTSSDWAAFRLSDDFGAAAGAAGMAYVAFTIGMTSGRFGGDWVIVRFGSHRVFNIAISMTVFALVALSFAPNRWFVLGAFVVAGLGVATQFPKLYDDAAKFPGRPGAGLGALTGGSRLALLMTPAVVGTLAGTSLSVGAGHCDCYLAGSSPFCCCVLGGSRRSEIDSGRCDRELKAVVSPPVDAIRPSVRIVRASSPFAALAKWPPGRPLGSTNSIEMTSACPSGTHAARCSFGSRSTITRDF